jgi:Mrp family chromosome partitioning ATPase
MMHIPVLGVVENFSYLECPDCGKKINIFGESKIEEVSNLLGVNLLGKLPLNPAYAEAADKGEFYSVANTELEVAKEILERI